MMRRRNLVLTATAACALAPMALPACRQSRRSTQVGGDAATLKVTMQTLQAEDLGRKDWLYELSGCTPTLNGELNADNSLTFKAVGLKKGVAGCQLRVKMIQAVANIQFAAGTEPNVLYWSKNVEITQDASGALTATAAMQQLYVHPITDVLHGKFQLKVPVKFAAPEAATPITARLTCAPAIAVDWAINPEGTPDAMTFTFTNPVDKETAYHCTEIQVSVQGSVKYKGKIGAGDADLTAKPDAVITFKEVALEVQAAATADGVAVSVEAKDCNQDGMIFDTATHTCVKKPVAPTTAPTASSTTSPGVTTAPGSTTTVPGGTVVPPSTTAPEGSGG